MLSTLDVYQLSQGGSDLQVVVKDGVLADLAEAVLADVEALRAQQDRLKPAGMGGGDSKWSSALFRSDSTCWVTPDLCTELGLTGLAQFVKRMIKETKPLQAALGLTQPEFSVQLAVYPAESAGYTRHLDVRPDAAAANKPTRKVTVLFYLNKHCQGGELRVFRRGAGLEELVSGRDYVDVEPYFSRAVVFRSDQVEHEVRPCGSVERLALTFWLSGVCDGEGALRVPPALADPSPAPAPASAMCPPLTQRPGGPPPLLLPSSLPAPAPAIFVSVACFRDSECQHTLRDLFLSAAFPARVFVGVVWQGDASRDRHCFRHFYADTSGFSGSAAVGTGVSAEWPREAEERAWWASNVRVLEMPLSQALGPCPARHVAQSLWRGEHYVLQIDAHMRFRGNWDAYLVALLEEARAGLAPGRRPVLTTYPLGYALPDQVPRDTRATLLVPRGHGPEGVLRQVGSVVVPAASSGSGASPNTLPLPCLLWAAGFSFSDCSVLHDCPYDPLLPRLFFGEEASMAARLFTHGYDLFAPPQAVLYHLWTRAHRPPALPEGPDATAQREQSLERVRRLLGGGEGGRREQAVLDEAAWGSYGLGSCRPLSELEAKLGAGLCARGAQADPGLTAARTMALAHANLPQLEGPAWIFADDADLCDATGTGQGQGLAKLAALDLVLQFVGREK